MGSTKQTTVAGKAESVGALQLRGRQQLVANGVKGPEDYAWVFTGGLKLAF